MIEILLKMEKSITQIINIRQEKLKDVRENGRNQNEQLNRGMEQKQPRYQGGNTRPADGERKTVDDLVRGSSGVVSDVHGGETGIRNNGLQAEHGAELHLQRGVGARTDRTVRQEVAEAYGENISRPSVDNENQQIRLGNDSKEGRQESTGAVSDLGQSIQESKSETDRPDGIFGNGTVGENAVNDNRPRRDGTGIALDIIPIPLPSFE